MLGVVLFGLIPARHAARVDVSEGIRQGSAIGGGKERKRLRRRFLLVQVALSALLLTTGSLFCQPRQRRPCGVGIPTGGNRDGHLDLQGRAIAPAERLVFFRRVLEEARQLPGVTGGTLSMIAELTGSNAETRIIPQEASDTIATQGTYFNQVGPDYHATLGIPLVRGRTSVPPTWRRRRASPW